MPADMLAGLAARLREILGLIEQAALALAKREQDFFASPPPQLRLVSPLADGADQFAAEAALESGWEVQAILPFERGYYRSTLANDQARERLDAFLERAGCVLELPGQKGDETEGYEMSAGRRSPTATC
jgi:hypothetical protein